MTDTPKLGLTYLAASQAQKHVTVNDALRQIDGLIQASAADKDLTAAPGSPSTGDAYIVASGATGVWAGQDDKLAVYHDTAWYFYAPEGGWIVYVTDENDFYTYVGGAWATLGSVFGGSFLPLTGGTLSGWLGVNGATPDATNPFAFYGTAALFNSDSDINLKFNKNAAGNDASMTFQTGFATYALAGLLGDNDYTVKVGTGLTTALVASEADGTVALPQNPKCSAYLSHDQYVTAGTWTKIAFNNEHHDDQGTFDIGTNQFTAPVDGVYQIYARACWKIDSVAIANGYLGISINGAATPSTLNRVKKGNDWDTGDDLQVTLLRKLSAGDTVEAKVNFNQNGYVEANTNELAVFLVP